MPLSVHAPRMWTAYLFAYGIWIAVFVAVIVTAWFFAGVAQKRLANRSRAVRLMATSAIFATGFLAFGLVYRGVATLGLTLVEASQGDHSYRTAEAALANHPEMQAIASEDPEVGKTISEEIGALAAHGPFVEGKLRDIYKRHIGPLAAKADPGTLIEYGKARLSLFQAAQQAGAGTCLRVVVGLYYEDTASLLPELRSNLAKAIMAAYQSGKNKPDVSIVSSEEFAALINKASHLPQSPLDQGELRRADDPNGSDGDLCRRMVHLQSNILLMDESDSIAYLRKEISIMSN
ncbi:MAG: hypothetical protein EPO08_15975 [Rhodospirillaceae bacterium]|nr:MAG: hypothetical protein EPO08_15975 [Rhodospirillaceae bacterium]